MSVFLDGQEPHLALVAGTAESVRTQMVLKAGLAVDLGVTMILYSLPFFTVTGS